MSNQVFSRSISSLYFQFKFLRPKKLFYSFHIIFKVMYLIIESQEIYYYFYYILTV